MYVVVENTPGYLPDSDPKKYDTYEAAVAYSDDLAAQLREAGYVCLRDGDGGYECEFPTAPYDLYRVIELIERPPRKHPRT